jgi:integrase
MAKRRSRGEGTIYQRKKDGLWSAQVTLPDGKRKTKYAKTQKEARDWLHAQAGQIKAGIWTSSDTVKLQDFIDRYLADVASKQVRPRTLESYRSTARLHIFPALGNLKLSALRPEHLQRLYADKIEAGLSAGTVQIIHGVLHQVLQQAAEWGVIGRNVAALTHPPRYRSAKPELLTRDQLRTLLETAKGRWWYPLIYLAIGTGMRRGELLALHWSDIDWEARTIHVRRIVTRVAGENLVTEPKTASSRRLVTLPPEIVSVLEDWQIDSAPTREIVFPSRVGGYHKASDFGVGWATLLKKAGVPHVRFHSLRHLHATYLLEAGVHAKVVSERLGHTNIGITLDLYSHVTAPLQQQAADTIGKAISGLKQ